METTGRLDRGDGIQLAWARLEGRSPAVVFLPGFLSDMGGLKALYLRDFCADRGQACLRFDYSGHGASGGRFTDGTIGRWSDDAVAVLDHAAQGKLVLVGSSMGGWIALLTALARPDRVAGLLGIAAAPDFTEMRMWDAMTFEERATLMETGMIHAPSDYGEPYAITRALIEDGRAHLLMLGDEIPLRCPIRLLQGQRDPDVSWETALRLADLVAAEDVRITLIKDGDHRLSRPKDLALLGRTLAALLDQLGGEDGA